MSLILAATDRAELVQTLGTELVYFGHQVQLARTGRRLLDDLDTDSFDIAVIDLLLPDIDGYEIARQIRLRSSMPIIMLVDTLEDIDEAPHRAVSDFVLNPIDSHALDLRVTAILRETTHPTAGKHLRHGDLLLDRRAMTATMGGKLLVLSRTEWRVLLELSTEPGRVYSRDHLIRNVWGSAHEKTRVVDATILSLRSKLESDPAKPKYIKTIRGFGYRFGPVD